MKTDSAITRAFSGIRWASVLISSVIWLALPIVMHAIDCNQTPSKWPSFWKSFPSFLVYYSIAFFLVAAIMHHRFAASVTGLSGWRFWLYPVRSLPLAASLYFVLTTIYHILCEDVWGVGLNSIGIVSLLYGWFVVLVVVMGSMIWLTYPLAILNQFVIRRFYLKSTQTTP